MIKRLFDIVFSLFSLIFLSPLFLILILWIKSDSKGHVIFKQKRVGKNNSEFKLYKFRTMYPESEKKGLITVGMKDDRITHAGIFLRKYKLDELPQLVNILKGDMSFVGPRPEVKKYVDLYNSEQIKVLSIKPGLTDYASIEYARENEILESYPDPEKAYIDIVMPAKLTLNLKYIREQSLLTDIKILLKTAGKIIN